MHRENVVKCDLRADLARQPLHPYGVARRDPVLFVPTANDGVHGASESIVKLFIINSSSRSVNAFPDSGNALIPHLEHRRAYPRKGSHKDKSGPVGLSHWAACA